MHKIVIFGDSISTPQIGNGGYQKKLQSLLQPDLLLNFAVAGSGAASCTPDNVLAILQCRSTDCADADAVILWHGTGRLQFGRAAGSQNLRHLSGRDAGALGLLPPKQRPLSA